MKYLILSLFTDKPESPLFWRGVDQDFTFFPFEAYHYSEEELAGFVNGTDNIAVPLTADGLAQLGFTCSITREGFQSFAKQAKS